MQNLLLRMKELDEKQAAIRLITSRATDESKIDEFIADLSNF
jgi:threonine aldolase